MTSAAKKDQPLRRPDPRAEPEDPPKSPSRYPFTDSTDEDVLEALRDCKTVLEIEDRTGQHRTATPAQAEALLAEIDMRATRRSGQMAAVAVKVAAGGGR
jgi:hypothetical protein